MALSPEQEQVLSYVATSLLAVGIRTPEQSDDFIRSAGAAVVKAKVQASLDAKRRQKQTIDADADAARAKVQAEIDQLAADLADL